MVTSHVESSSEEIANSITHGIGAVLSAIGLLALVKLGWSHPTVLISTSLFGASLFLMFLSSTVYHGCSCPRLKHRFHLLDLVAIYTLIAGTFTPYCALAVPGILGKVMLGLMWLLAGGGSLFTVLGGYRFPSITLPLYLLMGWLGLLLAPTLSQSLPAGGFHWMVTGGVSYSLGTVFYASHRFRFSHALWHLFVIAGGACHYLSIWLAAQASMS